MLLPFRITNEGSHSLIKGKKGVKNFYASRLYCELLSFVSSKVPKDINSSELPWGAGDVNWILYNL